MSHAWLCNPARSEPLEARIMNTRRFATAAAVLCETAFVACVAGFASTGTETTGAVAIVDRLAPALAANVEFADAPRAATTAVGNAAVDDVDIATVVKSVTVSYATPASDEPEPTVKVASTD